MAPGTGALLRCSRAVSHARFLQQCRRAWAMAGGSSQLWPRRALCSLFSRCRALHGLPAVPSGRGRPWGGLRAHHHWLPLGGSEKGGRPQKFLLSPSSLLGLALACDEGHHEDSAHLRVWYVMLSGWGHTHQGQSEVSSRGTSVMLVAGQ